MPDPVPNIALLGRVREHIRIHPEQHRQYTWLRQDACGTVGCIAGWAAHLSAVELDRRGPWYYVRPIDGGDWEDLGARLLGLTDEEAERLFDGSNELADIDEVIADIKARAASLAAPELVAEAEEITAAAQLVSA